MKINLDVRDYLPSPLLSVCDAVPLWYSMNSFVSFARSERVCDHMLDLSVLAAWPHSLQSAEVTVFLLFFVLSTDKALRLFDCSLV